MAELVAGGVTKLIARHDELDHDELVARIAVVSGDRATVTHGGSIIVEISAPGIDKAHGLRLLAAALGHDHADSVAFGDMPNDLPMLALAGRAIAVANAHPLVLAAADEVAPSNDEDGVAVVVERWFRA